MQIEAIAETEVHEVIKAMTPLTARHYTCSKEP
jgi:hypothetical protein